MGPQDMQHNVAGGWLDVAGFIAAATNVLTMEHGYNLDGDLDIANRRRLLIP
jgi:hypothetical protein